MLLRKPRSYAEVYNDLNGEIVNVFRVLRDPKSACRLEQLLQLTPFARDEFEAAYVPSDDPIEQARQVIIRSHMGFGSDSASGRRRNRTGFRGNSNRTHTTPAHDWSNFPLHVRAFCERLKGVVIENRDWRKVLKQHDAPDVLFYVDPPYVMSTRAARPWLQARIHR